MTSKQEMLNFPHRDGITAYLTHGWNKWDSPGPVDEEAVQVQCVAAGRAGEGHISQALSSVAWPVRRKFVRRRLDEVSTRCR